MEEKPYIQQLEEKLASTRERLKQGREIKNLKASAPTLFEIIDGEISLAVNRMTAEKPLAYDEYLSSHGEVKGIRRIRNLLDSKAKDEAAASAEVTQIEKNIKLVKNDTKPE